MADAVFVRHAVRDIVAVGPHACLAAIVIAFALAIQGYQGGRSRAAGSTLGSTPALQRFEIAGSGIVRMMDYIHCPWILKAATSVIPGVVS